MLSSFTLCYSFNSKNLAFPVIYVFSKWPLLVYCYITKKARIIIYTTFPTFLGSRNPIRLLFWKSEFNFRFYVELKPKISFLQISQLGITLGEKRLVIINQQKILYGKVLMWFFFKVNGFASKGYFNEKIVQKNCIIAYKVFNTNFREEYSWRKL